MLECSKWLSARHLSDLMLEPPLPLWSWGSNTAEATHLACLQMLLMGFINFCSFTERIKTSRPGCLRGLAVQYIQIPLSVRIGDTELLRMNSARDCRRTGTAALGLGITILILLFFSWSILQYNVELHVALLLDFFFSWLCVYWLPIQRGQEQGRTNITYPCCPWLNIEPRNKWEEKKRKEELLFVFSSANS